MHVRARELPNLQCALTFISLSIAISRTEKASKTLKVGENVIRRITLVLGLTGLLHGGAVAQDLSPQQRSAITAFATVLVASEVCGLELSASAIGEFAERRGLSPELLSREPYAGLQRAEEERLQSEAAGDGAAFCARLGALRR